MTDRELMQQALEKLEFFAYMKSSSKNTKELITALRERLAQPPEDRTRAFLRRLLDPEDLGHAVSHEVRQKVRELL